MPEQTCMILKQSLCLLERFYELQGLPFGKVQQIVVKPQWNAVIGTHGQCGLAINFTGIHELYGTNRWVVESLQSYIGQDLFQVAKNNLSSADMTDRCIGVAALSALSQPFLSPDALAARGIYCCGSMDTVGEIVQENDRVTIVGYGGMVRPLLGQSKELHVTEMRPKEHFQSVVIGQEIEYAPKLVVIHPAEENQAVLSSADVAILTGSSIINDTFDELWYYCSSARLIGVYGPSVSFLPDLLLDSGCDFVFSFWISDPEQFAFDAVNDVDLEMALKKNHQQRLLARKTTSQLKWKSR